MNAREELWNELRQWCSATEMEWVGAMFDAYRDEVLREAAEKIRNRPFVEHYGDGTFDDGSETAADLIDPEVP